MNVTLGRIDAARAMAEKFDRAAARLSPHHHVHGVGVTAEVEELAGGWTTLHELTPRIEQAVHANLATPCVRNQRTLLVCAAAARVVGAVADSERLEESAEALRMEGYDRVFAAPRARLALLRVDLDALQRLVATIDETLGTNTHGYWFELAAHSARLDALIVLGDRSRVEAAARPLLGLNSVYLEPFALRALGRVRGDRALIEEAVARFEQMRLDWHAEQTRALLTT